MTSQPPTGFENYPLQGQAIPIADPDPPPPQVAYQPPVMPAPLIPVPAKPSLGRRALLGALGALVLLPVAATVISGAAFGPRTVEVGVATEAPRPGNVSSGDYAEFGGFGAEIPDGWEAVTTDAGLIATKGANTLTASGFTDEGVEDVTDLVRSLAEDHRGAFKGRFGDAVDTSSSETRRATLTATGTVDGKTARVRADVWIGSDDNALFVIQILTSGKDSTTAGQAQQLADELSGGF